MIHIHLQRFRVQTTQADILPPIDRKMVLKLFRVDLVGVSIRVIEKTAGAVKSALKGVVTPTESYDLTIIPISKDEGYFCLLIESHPLGMPLKATLDLVKKKVAVKIIFGFFLKEFGVSIPSVQVPIEDFVPISKEDYESFTIGTYTPLTFPIEVIVKYVEEPMQEYRLGQSVTAKVQIIDPRTNEPIKGDSNVWACIRPSTVMASPMCVPVYESDINGMFVLELGTRYVYGGFPAYAGSEYYLYFTVFGPGYYGISCGKTFRISSERALFDIRHLSFGVKPDSMFFSENASARGRKAPDAKRAARKAVVPKQPYGTSVSYNKLEVLRSSWQR